MTKNWVRIFSIFFAVLFLLSASSVTIAVIVNGINNHKTSNNSSANSSQSTSQQQAAANCPETSITAAAEAKPAVYKPTASVTDVQSTDLVPGSGAAVKSGDCLQVKYFGTLAKDGTVFDENFDQATALQFVLGQGQVITGWDKGLVGAQVGGTRRLVIPAAEAYGSQGQGSIPPNADLVFVVQILAVK